MPNPNAVTLRVHPLTLSSLDDGEVAKQFAREFVKIADCFENDGHSAEVKASVVLKVEVTYNPATGNCALTSRVSSTLPKMRGTVAPIMMRDGQFLLEDEGMQLTLHDEIQRTGGAS